MSGLTLTIVTPRDMQKFLQRSDPRFERVESIVISQTHQLDHIRRIIQKCPRCTSLSFSQGEISDSVIQHITPLCGKIRNLTLFQSKISEIGLKQLSQWESLENLALHIPSLQGMEPLLANQKLKELTLFVLDRMAQKKAIEMAKKLPFPSTLSLVGSNVTNELISTLLQRSPIINLGIRCCNVSTTCLQEISPKRAPQKLKFIRTCVRSDDLGKIQRLIPHTSLVIT